MDSISGIFHWVQMPPGRQGAPITSYYTSPVYWYLLIVFPIHDSTDMGSIGSYGIYGIPCTKCKYLSKGKWKASTWGILSATIAYNRSCTCSFCSTQEIKKYPPCFNPFIYQYNGNEPASILWEKYNSLSTSTGQISDCSETFFLFSFSVCCPGYFFPMVFILSGFLITLKLLP